MLALGARLVVLVRPWWGQLILTFLLGVAHHGSVIGLAVIGALLVGQVVTGGSLTLFLILLGVFLPVVGFFTWAESWQPYPVPDSAGCFPARSGLLHMGRVVAGP
jgi:hypothetical protein